MLHSTSSFLQQVSETHKICPWNWILSSICSVELLFAISAGWDSCHDTPSQLCCYRVVRGEIGVWWQSPQYTLYYSLVNLKGHCKYVVILWLYFLSFISYFGRTKKNAGSKYFQMFQSLGDLKIASTMLFCFL